MENINIMDGAKDLSMCTCHFCGARFYSTTIPNPQIGVFCSEECLDIFCKETVEHTQNLLIAIKTLIK